MINSNFMVGWAVSVIVLLILNFTVFFGLPVLELIIVNVVIAAALGIIVSAIMDRD